MGNCVFKGFEEGEEVIKVITANGGVMELYAPVNAECITNEFPGHGIFRSPNVSSDPLLHSEELLGGESYYLLPLGGCGKKGNTGEGDAIRVINGLDGRNTTSTSVEGTTAPYRMSFDNQGAMKRSAPEVFPRYNSSGVWKVKLVISPQQLSEILSQEARTEALIESVRTVAKCGNSAPSTAANSDQWSLSGSWKASSEKYGPDD
ncbi:uncharacterized protein LOC131166910 [Malania oleifera]|uniref:uncharacterized protein LOC131166910 n=1 Tax=Malania oleifera TaxID=397392 RepID=UPI0025AE8A6F|nr:uncharacterized protein LOC131166910 [Malania oleifera]